VQKVFELATHVLLAGFGLIMTVYGYKLTAFKWATEIPLLNVTEGLRSLPVVLSGIFIFLFSIGHLIHFFNGTDQEPSE
jgi:TRAP-type C4-dicarboxylate transport system permease small subunit